MFQVPETVTAAIDVQDVTVVEQAIENGGGQDFVAGQNLRPVLDPLVGGDEDAAALIAVTDQAEQRLWAEARSRSEERSARRRAIEEVLLAHGLLKRTGDVSRDYEAEMRTY